MRPEPPSPRPGRHRSRALRRAAIIVTATDTNPTSIQCESFRRLSRCKVSAVHTQRWSAGHHVSGWPCMSSRSLPPYGIAVPYLSPHSRPPSSPNNNGALPIIIRPVRWGDRDGDPRSMHLTLSCIPSPHLAAPMTLVSASPLHFSWTWSSRYCYLAEHASDMVTNTQGIVNNKQSFGFSAVH